MTICLSVTLLWDSPHTGQNPKIVIIKVPISWVGRSCVSTWKSVLNKTVFFFKKKRSSGMKSWQSVAFPYTTWNHQTTRRLSNIGHGYKWNLDEGEKDTKIMIISWIITECKDQGCCTVGFAHITLWEKLVSHRKVTVIFSELWLSTYYGFNVEKDRATLNDMLQWILERQPCIEKMGIKAPGELN